jgi:phenylacetate-CoA ligase
MRNLIRKVPPWIKQPIKYAYGLIPYERRLGKVFWDTYNFLQESQWWSKEKLEEYQMRELEKLLKHAYENVPYYRRVFDERGLKPKDIQDFDDLKKLPYLTKEIIGNNLKDLVAQNYSRSKLQYITTGGSTGIPMGFYREKGVSDVKEHAFIVTLWNRAGYKLGDKSIVLRGNIIRSASKDKFWRYNPINKELTLSSYHMIDKTLPMYIAKIREFKPDFIQAFPSTITILARFMKKNNIKFFPSIKAIICGSENLYPWQRELLEEIMKCKIWSFYGHSEQAALAGECEKSTYYHIQPEYGIVELINKNGNSLSNEHELGGIVATGFSNYVCPFIRYHTMDFALPSNVKCECGRNYILLKNIEGRLQGFFVDKTGSLVTFNLSDGALWNVKDKINTYQYVQNEPGRVLLNICAKNKFSISDIESVRKAFLDFYPRFGVEIKFVRHIPRTKSGKFRYLIQKLPIEFGDY